jgi:hypothetical protein
VRWMTLPLLLIACASSDPLDVEETADTAETGDTERVVTGPTAVVQGRVWVFSLTGGPLPGARVTVLEHPSLEAVADEAGAFVFPEMPLGDVTLVMQADGYPENQLGTQLLTEAGIEGLNFQAVPDLIYGLFAALSQADPDSTRCQISTTITRWFEGTLPTVHGEPGATLTIDPPVTGSVGPVYFNEEVLPSPSLSASSVDGGVAWMNVPVGDYVLTAHKDDVTFEQVRVVCRAGVLVNAGPPFGLQGRVPGSGY